MELQPVVLVLVSAAVGAAAHYFFSRFFEKERESSARQAEAYFLYLRSVASRATAPSNQRSGDSIHTDLVTSKTQIALYGSAHVIHAMERLENAGANLDTPARQELFLQIVREMRSDVRFGRKNASSDALKALLFGVHDANHRN